MAQSFPQLMQDPRILQQDPLFPRTMEVANGAEVPAFHYRIHRSYCRGSCTWHRASRYLCRMGAARCLLILTGRSRVPQPGAASSQGAAGGAAGCLLMLAGCPGAQPGAAEAQPGCTGAAGRSRVQQGAAGCIKVHGCNRVQLGAAECSRVWPGAAGAKPGVAGCSGVQPGAAGAQPGAARCSQGAAVGAAGCPLMLTGCPGGQPAAAGAQPGAAGCSQVQHGWARVQPGVRQDVS